VVLKAGEMQRDAATRSDRLLAREMHGKIQLLLDRQRILSELTARLLLLVGEPLPLTLHADDRRLKV
jgi:hypothetical protein